MELTGLKRLKQLLVDSEFYKTRGHAVLACLSVFYLTIMYVAGVNVNLSIFADLTIAAGMLVIIPQIKLTNVESSNKLARNIFGYIFLSIVVFVAVGDSHGFLKLPGESKAEFFTIISHIMMVLFGASKIEVSRRAIEGVKDAFNWRRGFGSMSTGFNEGYDIDDGTPENTDKKEAERVLKNEVSKIRQPNHRNNILAAMQSYRGLCEVEGEGNNKKLISLAKKAGFSWYTNDDVPWCAVMMNIALMIAGVPGTKSASAKSFLKWGRPVNLKEARENVGQVIAIFHRGDSSRDSAGHVTVVESISTDGKMIVGIGGNQSDCVKSSKMRIDTWRFIGFRIP